MNEKMIIITCMLKANSYKETLIYWRRLNGNDCQKCVTTKKELYKFYFFIHLLLKYYFLAL